MISQALREKLKQIMDRGEYTPEDREVIIEATQGLNKSDVDRIFHGMQSVALLKHLKLLLAQAGHADAYELILLCSPQLREMDAMDDMLSSGRAMVIKGVFDQMRYACIKGGMPEEVDAMLKAIENNVCDQLFKEDLAAKVTQE